MTVGSKNGIISLEIKVSLKKMLPSRKQKIKNIIRLVAVSVFVFVFFPLFFFHPGDVLAMSSANYEVTGDTISVGGLRSTSNGYIAEDTLGELATGENLVSNNYAACAGFQCIDGLPYISFSLTEGVAKPGAVGAGVALGTLDTSSVTTSDGVAVNSIFILAESSADNGLAVTVTGTYSGLRKTSTASVISSATAALAAGTQGYGICVGSATEDAESPTAISAVVPYNGACDKVNNHNIGLVDTTPRTVVQSPGQLKGGDIEILVKASISSITEEGNDYTDTLTFIATGTY
ncbi:MAG: hypothetical protein ABIJ46_05460 [bacterium]